MQHSSGIVPALSLFKQHVNQMLQLDPETYATATRKHIELVSTLDDLHDEKKGSIFKALLNRNQNEDALAYVARNLERNVSPTPADIYVLNILSRMVQKQVANYLLLMASPIFGFIFFTATLSWNTLDFGIDNYPIMKYIVISGTIAFQVIFIITTLTVQQRNTLNVFIDLSFIILCFLIIAS